METNNFNFIDLEFMRDLHTYHAIVKQKITASGYLYIYQINRRRRYLSDSDNVFTQSGVKVALRFNFLIGLKSQLN